MAIPTAVEKVSDTIWEIPTSYKDGMRVPARIYATEKLMGEMDEGVIDQATNVATLPGHFEIRLLHAGRALGLGFPIGGVAPLTQRRGLFYSEASGLT